MIRRKFVVNVYGKLRRLICSNDGYKFNYFNI